MIFVRRHVFHASRFCVPMRRFWFRLLAAAQCVGGVGLIGWAALFYGLAGWGIGFSDLQEQLTAVLPWLAPLAVGPIIEARQGAAGRQRLRRVTAACALAALAAVVSSIVGRVEYPSDPAPLPWPLLLLLLPLGVALLFLGFVALAVPALAARTRGGRVLGWLPFGLGLAIAAYPETLVATEHLREWLLTTVAMLVSLGVGLFVIGGTSLVRGRPPELREGPEPREINS